MNRHFKRWFVRLADSLGWLNMIDRSIINSYLHNVDQANILNKEPFSISSYGEEQYKYSFVKLKIKISSKGNLKYYMKSISYRSVIYLTSALDWLFNATLAFSLLFITWPIILITSLLIKIEDGITAPIIYFQERVGLNEQIFKIYKFRSMRVYSEKHGALMASQNDNGVTKVGGFLRKYRIDNLPQIYNVICGDMRFIGPHPERPEFVQELVKTIPFYKKVSLFS